MAGLLLSDWHAAPPTRPGDALLPVRATCGAWRAALDADVCHVALTTPALRVERFAARFPGVSSLDLSRYCRPSREVLAHLPAGMLRCAALLPSAAR